MAYSVRLKDKTMTEALQRIARDRLDNAIAATRAETAEARMAAVHRIRKRLKELRGLIRLVRPDFAAYSETDRTFRTCARNLSPLRDIKVRADTLTRLHKEFGLPEDQITPYLLSLRAARDAAYAKDLAAPLLQDTCDNLQSLRKDTAHWELSHKGRKAVFPGLEKTYTRARHAMENARETRAVEAFHDWRKHVKYHRYHSQILSPIWPEAMTAHTDAATDLGELLGRHHDLSVLADQARAAGLPNAVIAPLSAALAQRAAEDERLAFRIGARLLADTPEALTRRWSVWWRLWRAG